MSPGTVRIRPATAADSVGCFRLFWESITDLAVRTGNPWEDVHRDRWPDFEALYGLLARIGVEWWVAEETDGGRLVGYARSIDRGGLFELAEFFVRPGHQSAGVGRSLLERAFPVGRGEVRVIVATADVRAVARYYAADTTVQFPIIGFNGVPAPVELDSDLTPLRLEGQARTASVDEIAAIERDVLGYDRGHELRWLLEHREAYLYRRGATTAGFAFLGEGGVGPIAALDPADLAAILRHVESRAHALGRERLGFEVPAPNVVATRHLLSRGYRIDPFVTFLMASRPFGRFDRYLGFTPPFVL